MSDGLEGGVAGGRREGRRGEVEGGGGGWEGCLRAQEGELTKAVRWDRDKDRHSDTIGHSEVVR